MLQQNNPATENDDAMLQQSGTYTSCNRLVLSKDRTKVNKTDMQTNTRAQCRNISNKYMYFCNRIELRNIT